MSHLNLQGIVSANVFRHASNEHYEEFSTVCLTDRGGFTVSLFVTAAQAMAIAAAFAPQVNEAGVPVFNGRAA